TDALLCPRPNLVPGSGSCSPGFSGGDSPLWGTAYDGASFYAGNTVGIYQCAEMGAPSCGVVVPLGPSPAPLPDPLPYAHLMFSPRGAPRLYWHDRTTIYGCPTGVPNAKVALVNADAERTLLWLGADESGLYWTQLGPDKRTTLFMCSDLPYC